MRPPIDPPPTPAWIPVGWKACLLGVVLGLLAGGALLAGDALLAPSSTRPPLLDQEPPSEDWWKVLTMEERGCLLTRLLEKEAGLHDDERSTCVLNSNEEPWLF